MRTKYFFTGLIIAIFAICSCEKEKAIETDIFLISYFRGSDWADYSYNVTINQNGLMRVTETNGLKKTNRKSEYRLVYKDIKMIKEKLNSVVKIDISDKYGFDNENAPTDYSITILSYKTTIKSESTSIYFPKDNELPKELDSFLRFLAQVIVDTDTDK
jgi:hypothetical protein